MHCTDASYEYVELDHAAEDASSTIKVVTLLEELREGRSQCVLQHAHGARQLLLNSPIRRLVICPAPGPQDLSQSRQHCILLQLPRRRAQQPLHEVLAVPEAARDRAEAAMRGCRCCAGVLCVLHMLRVLRTWRRFASFPACTLAYTYQAEPFSVAVETSALL